MGAFGAIILVVGIFVVRAIVEFYNEYQDDIKSVANLAKDGAKKSLDYTNKNTGKVRDYAIIIACIAVIIALIVFFIG